MLHDKFGPNLEKFFLCIFLALGSADLEKIFAESLFLAMAAILSYGFA